MVLKIYIMYQDLLYNNKYLKYKIKYIALRDTLNNYHVKTENKTKYLELKNIFDNMNEQEHNIARG